MYSTNICSYEIPKPWYNNVADYIGTEQLSDTPLYWLHSLALELVDEVFTYKNIRFTYSKNLNDISFEYFICPRPKVENVSIKLQMDENQRLIFDSLGSKTGLSNANFLYFYLWQVLAQFAYLRDTDYLLYKIHTNNTLEQYTTANYMKLEALRIKC